MTMRLLATAVLALAMQHSAEAQTLRCDTFAYRTTCTGPGGYRSTEDTFGYRTTGRDSTGATWTTDRFGDRTTTFVNPGSPNRW